MIGRLTGTETAVIAGDSFVTAKTQDHGLAVQCVGQVIAQWPGNLMQPAGIAALARVYSALPGK